MFDFAKVQFFLYYRNNNNILKKKIINTLTHAKKVNQQQYAIKCCR